MRRTRRLSISSAIVPLSLSGLLLGALLGCAKPMPQALVDARADVDAARNDADVVRLAPVQLDEAEEAKLDAILAGAMAQTAQRREAADTIRADIEALRAEAERASNRIPGETQ